MQINNNGELLISINGKTKLLSKEEIVKLYNQGIAIASESNSVNNTINPIQNSIEQGKHYMGYGGLDKNFNIKIESSEIIINCPVGFYHEVIEGKHYCTPLPKKLYNQGTTLAPKANSVTNTSHYIYPINRDSIYKKVSEILKKEYDKFPNETKKSWIKDDYPYFVSHTAESYPNPETSGDTVVDEIREKFLERSKVGQAKYGTNLDRKDLSTIEWLNHAIEEQMDSILYLTKLKRELSNKKGYGL